MAAGVVLCAGASSRLGRPKPLVDAGGEAAVTRVVRVLDEAGVAPVVVVLGPNPDAVRGAVPAAAQIVVNPHWERGRTGSLKMGLKEIPDAADLVVWPVDHPAVQASTVKALLTGPKPIRVPKHDGKRGHPTLFTASLRRELLALADDRPLHDVVRAVVGRVHEVEVNDPGILLNVDTPADLARLQEVLRGESAARASS